MPNATTTVVYPKGCKFDMVSPSLLSLPLIH